MKIFCVEHVLIQFTSIVVAGRSTLKLKLFHYCSSNKNFSFSCSASEKPLQPRITSKLSLYLLFSVESTLNLDLPVLLSSCAFGIFHLSMAPRNWRKVWAFPLSLSSLLVSTVCLYWPPDFHLELVNILVTTCFKTLNKRLGLYRMISKRFYHFHRSLNIY